MGAIAIGPSGVALIPLITNGHIYAYVLGLLAGYAGGSAVATYFLWNPKDALVGDAEVNAGSPNEVQNDVPNSATAVRVAVQRP